MFGVYGEAVEADKGDGGMKVSAQPGDAQKGPQCSLRGRSGSVDRAVIISIDWPETEIWGYPNID